MSCDACHRSRPTVRSDCGCCPHTVVVADDAACLPTTARLHLDELPFIKKLLQQQVQRQATATCSDDVVIRVHTHDRR